MKLIRQFVALQYVIFTFLFLYQLICVFYIYENLCVNIGGPNLHQSHGVVNRREAQLALII